LKKSRKDGRNEDFVVKLDIKMTFSALRKFNTDLEINLVGLEHLLNMLTYFKSAKEDAERDLIPDNKDIYDKILLQIVDQFFKLEKTTGSIRGNKDGEVPAKLQFEFYRIAILRKALLYFSPFGEHSAPLNADIHLKIQQIVLLLLELPIRKPSRKQNLKNLLKLVVESEKSK